MSWFERYTEGAKYWETYRGGPDRETWCELCWQHKDLKKGAAHRTRESAEQHCRAIARADRLVEALEDLLAYVENGYGDHESLEGEAARALLREIRNEKGGNDELV